MQVFDEGRLTDGKGRIVNFTNTIIIATSNLGSQHIQENLNREESKKKSYQEMKAELLNILRSYFRPKFLNRIDEIILFQSLTKEEIKEIVRLQLKRLKKTAKGQNINLNFDNSVIEHLTEIGYVPESGARELKRQIKTELETKIATEILKEGDNILAKFQKNQIIFIKK